MIALTSSDSGNVEGDRGHGPDVTDLFAEENGDASLGGQVKAEHFQHRGVQVHMGVVKVAQENALAAVPISRQREMGQEAIEAFRFVVEVLQQDPSSRRIDRGLEL